MNMAGTRDSGLWTRAEEPVVYLNGDFKPLSQACVPVLDRGFVFGDGVYEVVPVYGGRPFRLGEHLDRLDRSLAAVRIDNPLTREDWSRMFGDLLARNPGDDRSIYFQITRGVAKRDHAFPKNAQPTVFAIVNPLAPPDPETVEHGVCAITQPDIRWARCDIKAITLLANVLARQAAVDAGCVEAIFLRDGLAIEGSASNLFVVSESTIVTPPKDNTLLPGITRDLVVELALENGLPLEERAIHEAELRGACEVWLTSSTKEVMPVTRIDDAPVGDGRVGPLWGCVNALYQDYKAKLRISGEA